MAVSRFQMAVPFVAKLHQLVQLVRLLYIYIYI